MKYLLLSIVAFIFIGCGEENSTSQYENYFSRDAVVYDYYEIANNQILHTEINADIYNVSRVISLNGAEHITEHAEYLDNYHIQNDALEIDEYSNVYKENYLNLETDKSVQKVYKYNFGLYEMKTNYCLINVSESNCETYIYIRKI